MAATCPICWQRAPEIETLCAVCWTSVAGGDQRHRIDDLLLTAYADSGWGTSLRAGVGLENSRASSTSGR
jgi:hypothetical protein